MLFYYYYFYYYYYYYYLFVCFLYMCVYFSYCSWLYFSKNLFLEKKIQLKLQLLVVFGSTRLKKGISCQKQKKRTSTWNSAYSRLRTKFHFKQATWNFATKFAQKVLLWSKCEKVNSVVILHIWICLATEF